MPNTIRSFASEIATAEGTVITRNRGSFPKGDHIRSSFAAFMTASEDQIVDPPRPTGRPALRRVAQQGRDMRASKKERSRSLLAVAEAFIEYVGPRPPPTYDVADLGDRCNTEEWYIAFSVTGGNVSMSAVTERVGAPMSKPSPAYDGCWWGTMSSLLPDLSKTVYLERLAEAGWERTPQRATTTALHAEPALRTLLGSMVDGLYRFSTSPIVVVTSEELLIHGSHTAHAGQARGRARSLTPPRNTDSRPTCAFASPGAQMPSGAGLIRVGVPLTHRNTTRDGDSAGASFHRERRPTDSGKTRVSDCGDHAGFTSSQSGTNLPGTAIRSVRNVRGGGARV